MRVSALPSSPKSTLLLLATAALVVLALLAPQARADTITVSNFGGEGFRAGRLAEPGGVAVSPDGTRLFVADSGNHRIDEYTAGGRFVRAWGWGVRDGAAELETCFGPTVEEEENGETAGRECFRGLSGPRPGQLNEPTGVAVSPDGKTVYAINAAAKDGRIESFSVAGEKVTFAGALPAGFGRTGSGQANLHYPLPSTNDVAVGPDGRIYVADNIADFNTFEFSARVFVFGPERKLQDTIPVGFTEVTAMAVGSDNLIYVADRIGNLEVIDPAGGPTRQFSSGVSAGVVGIAFAPGSGNLLLEPELSLNSFELSEFTPSGALIRTIPVEVGKTLLGKRKQFGFAVDPTFTYEDESGRTFEPGIVYVVDISGANVQLLADQAPGKPSIESTDFEASVEGVALNASVSPVGADARVYFEYGTTSSYGLTTPAAPGAEIGAGFAARSVSAHLYGLPPGATYHYRVVATNALGTVVSDDRTFATFSIEGASGLPDGRAWEQVSTGKGTNSVTGDFAAPAGDGVAFGSIAPLPGSTSGAVNTGYVGLRLPAGWRTTAISPPVEDTLETEFLVSPDLTRSVGRSEKNLSGDAPPGRNLYLRDEATGSETLMTAYSRTSRPKELGQVGASADFGRVFFTNSGPLTPDTPEGFQRSLYEFSGGTLRNIGILPGASAPTAASVRVGSPMELTHRVSEDGSRVFFETEPAPQNEGETNADQLFVRIDGSRTVEVSASQAATPDPEAAGQPARFVGAAADGSAAFFTSRARLTDDADTGSEAGEPRDREPNLYRYDVDSGRLTDLTVATDPADEELGAAVSGGVLVADGGTSAYFVAGGKLAPGGVSGGRNLYRWTLSGGIAFVGSLGGGDAFSQERDGEEAPSVIARTTADGSVLMLTSETALDPEFPDSGGTKQIFRYAVADGSFTCVSCTHTVNRQIAARVAVPTPLAAGFGSHVLSSDGARLFFQTAAPLVARDSNGVDDVYEWEGGRAYLISSGSGSAGSKLVDASVSGDDVFFDTVDSLVPGDGDGYVDVYDAKVGGGFPAPVAPTPPCEAACRSSVSSAPGSSIGSRSFNGPPNPKRHRPKRHKKKHHKKHRRERHHKQSKQKRSHGQPAVEKRG